MYEAAYDRQREARMYRKQRCLSRILFVGCACLIIPSSASAVEYALGTYGLGSSAFGAGVTPPPGTYLTEVFSWYDARVGTAITFGDDTLNAGARAQIFLEATNLLYVPQRKVFGGTMGLSLTIPVARVEYDATLQGPLGGSRSVTGWGISDVVSRFQLGWQDGGFSHLIYVQAVAPTGHWEQGFSPITGYYRPGVDTGWAFTWTDSKKKIQLNGTAGFTFNVENTATNYQSGDEFHFEWAAGLEFAPGLMIGVVGYDYRQITNDSGSGDRLGPFKGRVDAVGPGLIYTTLIGQTPLVLNVRHYMEFDGHDHFQGGTTIVSSTIRF
jgi:hypothetical protein